MGCGRADIILSSGKCSETGHWRPWQGAEACERLIWHTVKLSELLTALTVSMEGTVICNHVPEIYRLDQLCYCVS